MSRIDIRFPTEQPDMIFFADDSNDTSFMLTHLQQFSGESLKVHWADDYAFLRYADIDNMVKALQKAKELWGNK